MAENLFGNAVPALGNAADGTTNYALGIRFTSAVGGTVTHGRWRFPSTIPHASTPVQIGVYRVSDQVLLGSTSFPLGSTLGAWNEVAFASPISITAGVTYVVVVWTPLRYVATPTYPWPATSASLTAAPSNGWLAVNPGGLAFPATQSGNSASYFTDVVFEAGGGGGASVAPAGLAVPVAVGAPTAAAQSIAAPDGVAAPVALGLPSLVWSAGVAPDGIPVPVAVGDPIVGAASVNPDGIAVAVAVGDPTLTWPSSIGPDGIAVPVVLGAPIIGAAALAPDGLSVPVALGPPSLAWSAAVSPDGILVPVVIGSPGLNIPGGVVTRPDSGIVTRSNSGVTVRPAAGSVTRPASGIVTRPDVGVVSRL